MLFPDMNKNNSKKHGKNNKLGTMAYYCHFNG